MEDLISNITNDGWLIFGVVLAILIFVIIAVITICCIWMKVAEQYGTAAPGTNLQRRFYNWHGRRNNPNFRKVARDDPTYLQNRGAEGAGERRRAYDEFIEMKAKGKDGEETDYYMWDSKKATAAAATPVDVEAMKAQMRAAMATSQMNQELTPMVASTSAQVHSTPLTSAGSGQHLLPSGRRKRSKSKEAESSV